MPFGNDVRKAVSVGANKVKSPWLDSLGAAPAAVMEGHFLSAGEKGEEPPRDFLARLGGVAALEDARQAGLAVVGVDDRVGRCGGRFDQPAVHLALELPEFFAHVVDEVGFVADNAGVRHGAGGVVGFQEGAELFRRGIARGRRGGGFFE